MSALVWALLSRTAEQAQPSAGRFSSVSLDKPAGHHRIGTHTLFLDRRDEAVLACLHLKKTGAVNEHEVSLQLPFETLWRCICVCGFVFNFSFLQITFVLFRHNRLPSLSALVLGDVSSG